MSYFTMMYFTIFSLEEILYIRLIFNSSYKATPLSYIKFEIVFSFESNSFKLINNLFLDLCM